jgi:hypothetical protein
MAVKATYTDADGNRALVIGITRGNVERLMDQKPMGIEVPEAIPMGGKVIILYAEDEQALADLLRPAMNKDTIISVDPRLEIDVPAGRKSS